MSAHIYAFSATEPQYVSSRTPNEGWLYINSQDAPPGADRTNCTMGTGEILATGMARIKVRGFAMFWNIPNVNPRNNVIQFQSSLGVLGAVYTTAPLNVRNYDPRVPADVTALIADIIAKMTAVAPGGQLFTAPAIVGFPLTFTLTSSAGSTFRMVPTSLAVAKGAQMFGFPTDQTFTQTKQLGPMNFFYSLFVDIVSNTLTKWSKMRSESTGHIAPLVLRAYVGGTGGSGNWGLTHQSVGFPQVDFSWKADEPLTQFDIRLFDQNGDPLYTLNDGKDLLWQLSLVAEM